MFSCRSFLALPIRRAAVLAIFIGLFGTAIPAWSTVPLPARVPIGPDLAELGWRELTPPDSDPTRFEGRRDGSLMVSAESSASFLYRDVANQARGKPVLQWRWRVDKSSPPTDLSRKGGDDRPLAVHLWFPPGAAAASRFNVFDQVLAWAFDVPLPGKVLTYVWGGTAAAGEKLDNPYLERDGVLIVLRPGDTPKGRWFRESIDVSADYAAAFGSAAPPVAYIAVSADFDDTMGASMAMIADIAFVADPALRPQR